MPIYDFEVELVREDGAKLPGIQLTPDPETGKAANGAGVVLVAGEWGLAPELVDRIGKDLAAAGFFVTAIDLVGGHRAATAEQARTRAEGIDHASAILDLEAAILDVKALASGKIGVLGLDLGATIALEAATQLPQIDAVVHAGGLPPGAHAPLARMRAAVLILRAEQSTLLAKADYDAIVKRAEPSKVTIMRAVYSAADGFFARPVTDDDRSAATIAMDRTRDFLVAALT